MTGWRRDARTKHTPRAWQPGGSLSVTQPQKQEWRALARSLSPQVVLLEVGASHAQVGLQTPRVLELVQV